MIVVLNFVYFITSQAWINHKANWAKRLGSTKTKKGPKILKMKGMLLRNLKTVPTAYEKLNPGLILRPGIP